MGEVIRGPLSWRTAFEGPLGCNGMLTVYLRGGDGVAATLAEFLSSVAAGKQTAFLKRE